MTTFTYPKHRRSRASRSTKPTEVRRDDMTGTRTEQKCARVMFQRRDSPTHFSHVYDQNEFLPKDSRFAITTCHSEKAHRALLTQISPCLPSSLIGPNMVAAATPACGTCARRRPPEERSSGS
uniref:Uncharacterized protein n=1 Tax=Steinernema glaseri TaxID=37863 RepID=A0A1I7YMP0_9BILA